MQVNCAWKKELGKQPPCHPACVARIQKKYFEQLKFSAPPQQVVG